MSRRLHIQRDCFDFKFIAHVQQLKIHKYVLYRIKKIDKKIFFSIIIYHVNWLSIIRYLSIEGRKMNPLTQI